MSLEKVYENATTKKIIDATNPGLFYTGKANNEALPSEAKWQIMQTSINGGVTIEEYANDGEFKSVWNDRASYFSGATGFKNDFALRFDGIDAHATVTNPALTAGMSGDWSHSVWFRPDNLSATLTTISIVGSSASDTPILSWLQINKASIYFAARGDGGVVGSIQPTITWTLGEWYHAAITRVGNVFKMYLNGIQIGTATIATGTTTCNLYTLGATKRTSIAAGSYFSGAIDEPSFFNRGLSQSEILDIFGGYRASYLGSFGSSLIAWHRLGDGDTHPLFLDQVNALNNLTAVNTISSDVISTGV